eukprot:SAG11_NODE_5776_length_1466_cov_1.171178_1_plen_108_part_10
MEQVGGFARAQLPQMYYGDEATGLMRRFPGRYTDNCGAYNPRVRPWYTGAKSPAKDVVILIDSSGSMGAKLDTSRFFVENVVGRLTAADSFAVIAYGERTQYLYPDNN